MLRCHSWKPNLVPFGPVKPYSALLSFLHCRIKAFHILKNHVFQVCDGTCERILVFWKSNVFKFHSLIQPYQDLLRSILNKQNKCLRKLSLPTMSKIDIQTICWDDFYTIPNQHTPPRPPEQSELTENLKIKFKSTKIFQKKSKIRPSLQKMHPL